MSAWLRQHRRAFGQALRRLAKATGLASALVIGIALSLPAGGYTLLESLRAIAARLTLEPQISLFLQPEAKRAEAEALGKWLLAGLLGTGLVAVTFNTIRLQILTQRDEIEVSKLIGATDAFIRRPFYYLGLLQGLAGGTMAVGIVAAALALLNREVSVLAESYGSSFRFAFLPTSDALAVVLFAGLLGWLGAHLSVSRHLRDIEPR